MSIPKYSPVSLYGIAKQIVRAWPNSYVDGKPQDCLQLQSFAVVYDLSILSAKQPFSSRELNKDFFYSRTAEATEGSNRSVKYPILIMNPFSHSGQDVHRRDGTECVQMWVSILDVLTEDCKNCTACQKRNTFEIEDDARSMIRAFFRQMFDFYYLKADDLTTNTNNLVNGFYPGSLLRIYATAGEIDTDWPAHADCLANSANLTIRTNSEGRWPKGVTNDNLHGFGWVVTFCFNGCDDTIDDSFDFEKADFTPVTGGCITCS